MKILKQLLTCLQESNIILLSNMTKRVKKKKIMQDQKYCIKCKKLIFV